MKIAAVYSVFNEEEYIAYSIASIREAVDCVVVSVNQRPWVRAGASGVSGFHLDRTEAIVRELARHDPKMTVQAGHWRTEAEHRQAGLLACLERGIDYYFLIDGDEVYRADHLQALRDEICAHPEVGTFQIKCTIFWRSFAYRIPHEAMHWTPWRVFKIDRARRILGMALPHHTRFIGDNKTNSLGSRYLVPPARCFFYHFSYARSEEKMRQKIATFSVAHRVQPGWLERVWLAWPQQRAMRDIHPLDPTEFPIAVHASMEDLPEVMRTHPYYQLDLIP